MIYLDNNATTKIDPEVLDCMLPFLKDHFANPSSSYQLSKKSKEGIDKAREQIAKVLNSESDELVFTGCGTESNNTAISSAISLYPEKNHIITSKVDHDATIEPFRVLEEKGYQVDYLDVDEKGIIALNQLSSLIDPDNTALVSLIWANNETGVLTPIKEACQIAHENGALFHTDAVQCFGKIDLDVEKIKVDYLSISGHKFHAPKGVGALFVSSRVRFAPYLHGGGQESGKRSGTENVAGIVAMGKAAELMQVRKGASIKEYRDYFESELLNAVPDIEINGDPQKRLDTTSSLYIPDVDAAGLLILLDQEEVYASAGSACHTSALHVSHVLTAMGFDRKRASQTMRFSFSRFNSMNEVKEAVPTIEKLIKKMKSLRSAGPIRSSS